jgi:hypothetical protein
MNTERVIRAQLIQIQVERLNDEVKRCDDLGRIRAIRQEMEAHLETLRQIREEQLRESLPKPKRRWFHRSGSAQEQA